MNEAQKDPVDGELRESSDCFNGNPGPDLWNAILGRFREGDVAYEEAPGQPGEQDRIANRVASEP